MSNDLISRSVALNYLREQHAKIIIEKNENKYGIVMKDVLKGMQAAADAFINFIVQVPTAYDADKVVEQLEECIVDTTDTETGAGARWAYKGAIKIVKAGGKGDNN